MDEAFEIITVDADNIDRHGFFCYMSKRKALGYAQKCAWLAARFAEGLKLHMVHETGGRTVGFIEYIPGEFAWRAVHAPGYLVIHCLWVVGKGKGKGYGARLIQGCLDDARAQGKHGVVVNPILAIAIPCILLPSAALVFTFAPSRLAPLRYVSG